MNIKRADIFVALYILAAFVMLIVPIPNWLLDILLAVNISTGFVTINKIELLEYFVISDIMSLNMLTFLLMRSILDSPDF